MVAQFIGVPWVIELICLDMELVETWELGDWFKF